MRDVLHAVSKETGAVIDCPSEANQPVTRRLGPAPLVDVLDLLLKPLNFDYAILGSASEPNSRVRVILSAKPSGTAAAKPVQGPELARSPEPAQADAGSPAATASGQEAAIDPISQRFLQAQQDLMERLNARGAPADEDSLRN